MKTLHIEIAKKDSTEHLFNFSIDLYKDSGEVEFHEIILVELDEYGIDFSAGGAAGAYINGVLDGLLIAFGFTLKNEYKKMEESLKKYGSFSENYEFVVTLDIKGENIKLFKKLFQKEIEGASLMTIREFIDKIDDKSSNVEDVILNQFCNVCKTVYKNNNNGICSHEDQLQCAAIALAQIYKNFGYGWYAFKNISKIKQTLMS